MKEQVDIFEDPCWVYYVASDDNIPGRKPPKKKHGPYYCANKAKEKLFTLLSKGICAWVIYDVRKTEFWGFKKG